MQLTRRALFNAFGNLALSEAARGAVPSVGSEALASIERAHGGRLGVFAFDTASAKALAWRADEVFPMASTFKGPLAAMVLERVQEGRDRLQQELSYSSSDMMPVSPVTEEHLVEGKLTIERLTAAILEVSDNTAANILLAHVGGPADLTLFLRKLGDNVSKVRRPEMKNPPPGVENTTSPRGYATLMQMMLSGPILEPSKRKLLKDWMTNNHVGRERLRASFPRGWVGADRTGTGNGICNDGALAWLPGRAPLAMAAFYVAPIMGLAAQEAVLREVSSTIVTHLL